MGIYANYAWLASNSSTLDKYAGKWVAIVEGRVIAVAQSMKELMHNPEVQKEKSPLITKIPMPEEAYSLL